MNAVKQQGLNDGLQLCSQYWCRVGGVTYLNPMIGYHGYYSYRSVMVAMVTLQVSNGCHGYVPQ